jgi:Alw26I/Eco31I/Esp3I family type II restriction m6 adenine DNA methyltransferase
LDTQPVSLAVDILRETSDHLVKRGFSSNIDSFSFAEIVRMVSLSRVLNLWDNRESAENRLLFKTPSIAALEAGTDPDEITKMASEAMDEISDADMLDLAATGSILELTDTLGIIHSIGMHTSSRGYSVRRLTGAFYTPHDVASYIAEKTIRPYLDALLGSDEMISRRALSMVSGISVLDPCCGPGVFLVAAFRTISAYLRSKTGEATSSMSELRSVSDCLEKIAANFVGVDLDPASLEIAQRVFSLATSLEGGNTGMGHFHHGNSIIDLKSGTHSHFFRDPLRTYSFEWNEELKGVVDSGTFDIVLFNPPYSRMKPNRAEFMRAYLSSGHAIVDRNNYTEYERRMREEVDYYRNSGEYSYGLSSSINTYHLFIERVLDLTKPGGRVGFIVPATLLRDYSARRLRRHLMLSNCLLSLDEFSEAACLFPDVTQSVCIATVKKNGVTEEVRVRTGLDSLAATRSSDYHNISVDSINEVFGSSFIIPQIEPKDWAILRRMHRNPPLASYPWISNHRGELDLTIDKDYISNSSRGYPLIRGSDIERYSLQTDTLQERNGSIDAVRFADSRPNSIRTSHMSRHRIACQQISNLANRWRLKFSMIEPHFVLANSCNYLVIDEKTNQSLLEYLLGIMNSELMNWRFSVSSSNNHISNRELSSLPLVDPMAPVNKEHAAKIIELVRQVRNSASDDIMYQVEACVFSLYGFGRLRAKRVLKHRGIQEHALNRILDHMP